MQGRKFVMLVDPNARRRASIVQCFSTRRLHVEPFETAEELSSCREEDAIVLLYDEGEILSDVKAVLAKRGLFLPMVAYHQSPAPQQVAQAVLAGAMEYLPLPLKPNSLEGALNVALERFECFGKKKQAAAKAQIELERLSKREREVLLLLAEGRSNKKIANELAISPRTVEIHRANMMSKLDAKHVADCVKTVLEVDFYAETDQMPSARRTAA